MKIPAPCMTGQEAVIDFAARRAKASPDLRDQLQKTRDGLAAGMTPKEIRELEIAREREKINAAMRTISVALKNLSTYTTEAQIDIYVVTLQELLPKLVGGKS